MNYNAKFIIIQIVFFFLLVLLTVKNSNVEAALQAPFTKTQLKPMTLNYAIETNSNPSTSWKFPNLQLYECAAFSSNKKSKFEQDCVYWTCYRQLQTTKAVFQYTYAENTDQRLNYLEEDRDQEFVNLLFVERMTFLKVVQITFNEMGRKKCEIREHRCQGLYAVLKRAKGASENKKLVPCPKNYIDATIKIGK